MPTLYSKDMIDPEWLQQAKQGKTKKVNSNGTFSTVRTIGWEQDGKYLVAPTIRLIGGIPIELNTNHATQLANSKGDAIEFNSQEEADAFVKSLSEEQGRNLSD